MSAIQFQSNSPLDHACRALDIVRRMGLEFGGMHTEPAGRNRLLVRLELVAQPARVLEQVAARIANLPGATEVTWRKPVAIPPSRRRPRLARNQAAAEESRADV